MPLPGLLLSLLPGFMSWKQQRYNQQPSPSCAPQTPSACCCLGPLTLLQAGQQGSGDGGEPRTSPGTPTAHVTSQSRQEVTASLPCHCHSTPWGGGSGGAGGGSASTDLRQVWTIEGRVPSPLTEALSHLHPISPGFWATQKNPKGPNPIPYCYRRCFCRGVRMKLSQKKKSKKRDAKSGQADESAATPAKKSRKPYPRLGDANLPMQTTPFLFFLESIRGLRNRQSQIATPRHHQGKLL